WPPAAHAHLARPLCTRPSRAGHFAAARFGQSLRVDQRRVNCVPGYVFHVPGDDRSLSATLTCPARARRGIVGQSMDSGLPAAGPPRGRRRWWQFGLRGLLLLVLLIAIGLLACRQHLKRYWRQQQTVELVEKLGGSYQTVAAGGWWLRLAGTTHNVTQ